MKSEKIVNKKGDVLVSKDGKELIKHRLESGDEFIPQFNKIMERENECQDKTIINYSLKCVVRDANGEYEVFVDLTPPQAESIKKKLVEGVEITQEIWTAYEYKSKFGKAIGVNIKRLFKDPIKFPTN